MIRSKEVINSARGAFCSARFPGICNSDPATTVWCHLNGHAFGKGAGIKAHDVLGFAGCSSCHAYYDVGHGTRPLISNDTLLECVLSAVCESYVRLIVAGTITVPRDLQTPASERAIAPRKPREQRAKVPASANPIPQRENPWPARGTRKVAQRQKAISP